MCSRVEDSPLISFAEESNDIVSHVSLALFGAMWRDPFRQSGDLLIPFSTERRLSLDEQEYDEIVETLVDFF